MNKKQASDFFKSQIYKVEQFGFEMLDTQEFQDWKDGTEMLIRNSFPGDNDFHINKFMSIRYRSVLDIEGIAGDIDVMLKGSDEKAFRQGVDEVVELLRSFIGEIEKFR